MKIKTIEKAVSIFEESASIHAKASIIGDYKVANKNYDKVMDAIVFLHEVGHLSDLYALLNHDDIGVRLSAAYALLLVCEDRSKAVLSALAHDNFGILSLNAEMVLEQWKEGKLVYPFQDEFNKSKK